MMFDNKSLKELKRLMAIPENLKAFVEDSYNLLIDDLNNMLGKVSFTRNFDSQIFKGVTIPASSTLRISHGLGVVPEFRTILRQSGGGLITDGEFTKKYIELVNAGGTDAIVTVALFKE